MADEAAAWQTLAIGNGDKLDGLACGCTQLRMHLVCTVSLVLEIGFLFAIGLVLTLCVVGRRRRLKNEQRRDALERVRYFARRSL